MNHELCTCAHDAMLQSKPLYFKLIHILGGITFESTLEKFKEIIRSR